MENYIIQYWINKLIIGYTISTITFFLIVLINKSLRQKIKPFLSNSNLILFFVLTINVIINFKQAVLCKNGFDFYNSRICFIPFLINFLFLYLFQMLFVLKKFRENLFLTIFTLISFVLFANFEHFIFFFWPPIIWMSQRCMDFRILSCPSEAMMSDMKNTKATSRNENR